MMKPQILVESFQCSFSSCNASYHSNLWHGRRGRINVWHFKTLYRNLLTKIVPFSKRAEGDSGMRRETFSRRKKVQLKSHVWDNHDQDSNPRLDLVITMLWHGKAVKQVPGTFPTDWEKRGNKCKIEQSKVGYFLSH